MKEIKSTIHTKLRQALVKRGIEVQENLPDDLVLLQSGLDSMGFAVLVTQLEIDLGYDPFVLMDEPVYPRTLGDFVGIYEQFKDHAQA